MGNVSEAMNQGIIVQALCYELALWLLQRFPKWSVWLKMVLDHCKPSWIEWKTFHTLKKVDEQAVQLKEQWEKEEREHRAESLAQKAQELFPDATITPLPDAVVPSVMIVREAAPDASDDVKALGGELRITWRLD